MYKLISYFFFWLNITNWLLLSFIKMHNILYGLSPKIKFYKHSSNIYIYILLDSVHYSTGNFYIQLLVVNEL